MKHSLALLGMCALIAMGCGKKEPDSAAPPAEPPAVRQPGMPPAMPPPISGRETAPRVKLPREPRAESLDQLVQQYQSVAGQTETREGLIQDIAGKAGDAPADTANALARLLGMETDPELQSAIIEELGDLEHPAALDPILNSLTANQSPEVREAAIDASDTLLSDLGFTEDPAMFPVIVKATDSRYPSDVRQAAISALEDLEDKRAIPVLQKLLNDPDPEVREAAKDAIDWLTD